MASPIDYEFYAMLKDHYDALCCGNSIKRFRQQILKDKESMKIYVEKWLSGYELPSGFFHYLMEAPMWDNILEDIREYIDKKDAYILNLPL